MKGGNYDSTGALTSLVPRSISAFLSHTLKDHRVGTRLN